MAEKPIGCLLGKEIATGFKAMIPAVLCVRGLIFVVR